MGWSSFRTSFSAVGSLFFRYAAPPARSERTKWFVVMSEFAPICIALVISLLVSLILLCLPFVNCDIRSQTTRKWPHVYFIFLALLLPFLAVPGVVAHCAGISEGLASGPEPSHSEWFTYTSDMVEDSGSSGRSRSTSSVNQPLQGEQALPVMRKAASHGWDLNLPPGSRDELSDLVAELDQVEREINLSLSPAEGREARQERFERLQMVLDEVDRRLGHAREMDRIRDNEGARLRAEMDNDCDRLRALERKNGKMRFQVNELNLKKRGPLIKFKK